MGRARGVTRSTEDPTGSRRRRGLSLIQGGAEPSAWIVTSLERLTRALDLRPIGFRRYEAIAAEARWPAFPGAQLVASAVMAAERSLPGVSVGHLSCSFGPLPRADHPVEVAMSEVHIGESCITGRLTFRQRSAVHGEATVLLRPCASQVATDQLARSLRPAGQRGRRAPGWRLRPCRFLRGHRAPCAAIPLRSRNGICVARLRLARSARPEAPGCGRAFPALCRTARYSERFLLISVKCCRSMPLSGCAIPVDRKK